MPSCLRTFAFVTAVAAASVLHFQTMMASPAQKPQVKTVAAQPIQSIEGADNFAAYCAVCHGKDAKGNGPAAPAMKTRPPDLTLIAKRHGRFSATDVEQVIKGGGKTATPAHGNASMPIWGDVFMNEDESRQTMRFTNLVRYLESIQTK